MSATGESIQDYITGRELPYSDDEYIRQDIERLLVHEKGYRAEMIEVERSFVIRLEEEALGRLELLVRYEGRPFMAIKCVRGSLVTREREALAASRLALDVQIPLTVITNGDNAEILDTLTGQVLDLGLDKIPDLDHAKTRIKELEYVPLPDKRREKEERIYLAFMTFQCPSKCPV
ncbi:MAG: type I restriction enzyme HsdR N-terminal domain-containing protein [Deltaproteobacteria bacterium]|nr:type I restriction enzyme HsdR N-terminal domain-containing protein [Deltaproteobacteria bacterium]MBW2053720.1 type I restriction enzyme HsdR N-terminal domain-containing protein [Deltaproteobacteria bacterium]MBW2142296.1 type I restriction enzyme HsdR N-terminal domain-containing protein [Deltaproteobacteria bacterium]MBW2324317.1 type I restriction enzyme HsdR N-terminal domain-containing protein [Deltaproteobacteria bacterium]